MPDPVPHRVGVAVAMLEFASGARSGSGTVPRRREGSEGARQGGRVATEPRQSLARRARTKLISVNNT